jgi:acetylornithine deacetylase
MDGWQMDEDQFVGVLGKLIGEAAHLQNNPPDFTPVEDRGALS